MSKLVTIHEGTAEEIFAAMQQLGYGQDDTLDNAIEVNASHERPSEATQHAINMRRPVSVLNVQHQVQAWWLSWAYTIPPFRRVHRNDWLLVEISGSDGMDGAYVTRVGFTGVRTEAEAQACILLAANGIIDGETWDV